MHSASPKPSSFSHQSDCFAAATTTSTQQEEEELSWTMKHFLDQRRSSASLSLAAATTLLDHVDVRLTRLPGETSDFINVEIAYLAQRERPACHFICMIDTSGSMGSTVSTGQAEKTAFTSLDLAKHSLKVLFHMLGPQDSLCLISFSNRARVVCEESAVDAAALARLLAAVDTLNAAGGTNIWSALSEGLEQASKVHGHSTLLLLTDGQPTPSLEPKGGSAAAFAEHYRAMATKNISLHTLGYGYDLDSQLLAKLADANAGLYAFIPDATMVGTVFINFTCSVLATAFHHVWVVEESKGVEKSKGAKGAKGSKDKRATGVDLGAIQFGQQRNFAFEAPQDWASTLHLYALDPVSGATVTLARVDVSNEMQADERTVGAYARQQVLKAVTEASQEDVALERRQELLRTASETLEQLRTDFGSSEELEALLSDVAGAAADVGQLGHAVEKREWYNKWGRHYLPSVASAQRLQVCMNFKDAALQLFKTPLFTTLQQQAETLFCTLPPPQPTGEVFDDNGCLMSAAPASMTAFYDYSGGCFHGSNLVAVEDGSLKSVRALQRGDKVLSYDGQYHDIACVVVTPVPNNTATYYDVGNGVLLTAYHPVWAKGQWAFPIDVGQRVDVPTEAQYNFLLHDGVDMMVEGVRCITLAHGITESTVAAHAYLGTQRVAEDIKAMRGWSSGRVVLDAVATERCPRTHTITRWVEFIE